MATMNIYAKRGDKILFTGNNGTESDMEHANKYLTVGEVYTVKRTNVGAWRTGVWLEEIPDYGFNSVMFNDYKLNQPEVTDKNTLGEV